jgi:hypothetical protein
VLGARPRSLARLVLGTIARPVGIGSTLGVIAASWLSRLAGSHTFGLLALDPRIPIGVAALLMVAAVFGALNPCRHATRVDPIVALRE